MSRFEAAGLPPLLEQHFDHAERNSKAPGGLFLRAFATFAGADDTLTKIEGQVAMPSDTSLVLSY